MSAPADRLAEDIDLRVLGGDRNSDGMFRDSSANQFGRAMSVGRESRSSIDVAQLDLAAAFFVSVLFVIAFGFGALMGYR